AGWWDEAVKARETTLDELRAAPERLRDVPVTLVVRFVRSADAPTRTGDAAEWRGFSASASPATVTPQDAAAAAITAAVASAAGGVAPERDAQEPVTFDGFVVRRGSAEDARLATLRAGE